MPSSDNAAPIQAYYKLSFPNFEYYLQTLSVSIGRRPQTPPPSSSKSRRPTPVPEDAQDQDQNVAGPSIKQEDADALLKLAELAASALPPTEEVQQPEQVILPELPSITTVTVPQSPQPSTSSARRSGRSQSHSSAAFPHVDVDLGPLKSVSRLHARIDYDDTLDKFVLYVNGRNGAWVDGEWVGCGGRVALGARTKIQIATRTFYFILPPPADLQPPLTPGTTPDADVEPTSPEDVKPSTRPRTPSPLPAKPRRRLPQRSPQSSSPLPKNTKKAPQPPPPLPDAADHQGSSSSSTQSSSTHASQNAPDQDASDSENEQLVEIDELEQIDLDELQAMGPQTEDESGDEDAKGKANHKKGKSTDSRKAPKSRAPRKMPKLLDNAASGSGAPFVQLHPIPAKVAKNLLKPPPDPNQPRQPKKYMTQRLIAKTQLMQQPRPPPEQMPPKPPFTYALLCFRAISELGGKASLSEIVNWIRDTYEWYRWNDECGWESSVRHNLSSNPGFVKSRRDAEVERIAATTGQQKKAKGFFWSIDPKAEESFKEKEREIVEAGSRAKAQQKAKLKESGADGSSPVVALNAGPLAKPAMPVPMMAPRGMPGPPPPPPVGMSMVPPMMHPGSGMPHMVPPMMMHPPQPHAVAPPQPRPPPPPPPPPAVQLALPTSSLPTPGPAFPQALPDVCLSITVGPPPPGTTADPASSPYVDGPPITLHNGALFLNPTIFSGLTHTQIDELQKLKAQKALEILMGYTKNYVKEQILKKGKAKGKGKKGTEGVATSTSPTPAPAAAAAPNVSQVDTASILALASLASASAAVAPPGSSQSTMSNMPPQPTMSLPNHPPAQPYPYAPFAYPAGGWSYAGQPHHLPPPQYPPPMVHYPPGHGHMYPQYPQMPPPSATHAPPKHALEETATGGPPTKKAKVDAGQTGAAKVGVS